jgi:hypothetical protein
MKPSYLEKLKNLRQLRQDIKKKRILLDESVENFGLREMTQLAEVKNKDEIKGYPFLGVDKRDNRFSFKIVPIEKKYNKHKHPSFLECIFLKELTDAVIHKNISPHIVYYLGYQKVSNKSKALKFLNLRQFEIEGAIHSSSNMLIADYIESGSLNNWIYDMYENKQTIDNTQWKIIAFQLIYTLAVLQKHYKMMHNDCHYGNILIDTSVQSGGYFVYKINKKKYYIPNTGIIPKFWDFEFTESYNDKIESAYTNQYILSDSNSNSTESSDEHNVPYKYNDVYDLHYLLTSLLDLYISEDLFDWILNMYPDELIPEEPVSSDTTTSCTESKKPESDNVSSLLDKLTLTSSSSGEYQRQYLKDGRIINGIEEYFDLPNPMDLVENEFFSQFLEKPDDYSEHNSSVFDSGF